MRFHWHWCSLAGYSKGLKFDGLGDHNEIQDHCLLGQTKWSLGNFDVTSVMDARALNTLHYPTESSSHRQIPLFSSWWRFNKMCASFRGFVSVRSDSGVHFQTLLWTQFDGSNWNLCYNWKIEKTAVWFFRCYKEWAPISTPEGLRY